MPDSRNLRKSAGLIVFCLFSLMALFSCSEPKLSHLDQIKAKGELRIVTRMGPTTYFIGGNGPSGFEYDLSARFAEYLGVKLSVISADGLGEIQDILNNQQVDMAAAGLSITPHRQKLFHFSPPYQEISVKLVFKQGEFWPRNFKQLDGRLTVLAQSSHAEHLLEQKQQFPWLTWHEVDHLAVDDLVENLLDKNLSYTLIDSNDLALQRRYHPDLAIAFTVAEKEQLAWAFRKEDDDSLYHAAAEFFTHMQVTGDLAQLHEIYYGHLEKFDYVGSKTFLKAARETLTEYRPMFETAGNGELDWRLLAAISYQESHWNPKARSPTGVRGMMMLTNPTAKQLGVKNRLDAEQSIHGGARYYKKVLKKIPSRIAEPDRTWLALASYNVGFGHLEDARIITQHQGANPDKWLDVKERLPLLQQKKWYKHTRHGYARGSEPVHYVDNVRRYYEVLDWLFDEEDVIPIPAEKPEQELLPQRVQSLEKKDIQSNSE